MEKRGLGRGLAALISDSLSDEGETRIKDIPVDHIQANPFQPRSFFDPIKHEEMVLSVREHGVLQPILIRRVGHDSYQLVAGERRFRAAQAAGLASIPAMIRECTDREQLEMAIVENLQREDIGALEAARAYRRMSDEFGMTQDQIAQRLGKSRTAITNTLSLLDLPDDIQNSVEQNEITEGHARALRALRDPEMIRRAWQYVVQRSFSVRDTEKLVRDWRTREMNASSTMKGSENALRVPVSASQREIRRADPNETAFQEALQEALQTKVTLRFTGGGIGRIEIEFYSQEELERICERIAPARLSS